MNQYRTDLLSLGIANKNVHMVLPSSYTALIISPVAGMCMEFFSSLNNIFANIYAENYPTQPCHHITIYTHLYDHYVSSHLILLVFFFLLLSHKGNNKTTTAINRSNSQILWRVTNIDI
jgi:hypothetical protein